MSKLVRYEFIGDPFLFWVAFISVLMMPFALLYLVNRTVRIETDMADPEAFIQMYRSGGIKKS